MRDDVIRDGQATEAPMRAPDDGRSIRSGESSAFRFENRSEEQSLPELLRELAHQGSHLAEQQTRLVEAEVRSATTDLKESVAAMGGAAVLGIASVGVLLMGVSFLLGSVMPLWLATMIVGLVTLAAAYGMYTTGKGKLQSKALTMDRTRHTMERAPRAMSGNEKEMHHDR